MIVFGNLGEHDITFSFEQLDMKGISVLEGSELSTIVVWKRRQNHTDTKNLTHCNILSSQCATRKKDIEALFCCFPITITQAPASIQQQ